MTTEEKRRIIIGTVGILDLIWRAILGVYRLGLVFIIMGFMALLGDWVEGREFSLIIVVLIACLLWFIAAVCLLAANLIVQYRFGRRALRVYLRCKNTSQVIQLNRALWKRIWEEPVTFVWEDVRLEEQKRRERIALRERWGEQNSGKR